MATTYLSLPLGGSPFYGDPVANFASLPAAATTFSVRLVEDVGVFYYFDGATWLPVEAAIASGSVADTNSIDLTVTAGVITADARLSTDVADSGYILGELAIRSGSSKGFRSQIADSLIRGLVNGTAPVSYNSSTGVFSMAAATTSVNGYLTSTDWNTFNGKQDAITAGTTADYWRGDKTFQTLQMSALTAITSGTVGATGKIGEILTASQASNTSTGVGSTGVYGNVISLDITAGRWQVSGTAGFSQNAAVLTTGLQCGISASSSGSGISEFDTTLAPFLISGSSDALIATPVVYLNLSSTTTYYLNTKFTYTSGTPQHRGKITAIRIG